MRTLLLLWLLSAGVLGTDFQVIYVYKPPGCGQGLVSGGGDLLTVHYTGTIDEASLTGTKGAVFDSSVSRGQPFEFTLGVGQVIRGWDMGMEGMCVGEQRALVIPPEYGYGGRGAGNVIPPGATLHFDVSLLLINGQAPPPSSSSSSDGGDSTSTSETGTGTGSTSEAVSDPKDLLVQSSAVGSNLSMGPLPIFGIAFSVGFVLLLCMLLALAIRNRGRHHRRRINALPTEEDGAADPSSPVFSPILLLHLEKYWRTWSAEKTIGSYSGSVEEMLVVDSGAVGAVFRSWSFWAV